MPKDLKHWSCHLLLVNSNRSAGKHLITGLDLMPKALKQWLCHLMPINSNSSAVKPLITGLDLMPLVVSFTAG